MKKYYEFLKIKIKINFDTCFDRTSPIWYFDTNKHTSGFSNNLKGVKERISENLELKFQHKYIGSTTSIGDCGIIPFFEGKVLDIE